MPVLRVLGLLMLLGVVPHAALAQGGNVFGPSVRADDRSAEWRYLAAVDEDGSWSQGTRLHYQEALNAAWRLRGVVQAVAAPGEDWDGVFTHETK